jgi:hypothetical protein
MASKHHSIREKQNKLMPQTHSPEVYYSLFIMVAVLVISVRLEKRPGVTLVAFPPPIFAGTTSVSLFCVSPPPPQGNASRGLYIGVFRSR